MAHGGHSGGARIHSHPHYRRSSWNGGFDSDNIGAILLMSTFLIVIIVAVIFKFLSSDNIGDKKPLEGNYKVVQYLHDDDVFSNQDELLQGLEYLKEKTNVQMIVMTSSEKWSDKKAVEEYYLLVEDEAHVLLIVPPEGSKSPFYYAIGDEADTVIDDKAIKYFIKQVEDSRDSNEWNKQLCEFADKLMESSKTS